MVPLQCGNCRAPLGGDDAFCGRCGTRADATAAGNGAAGNGLARSLGAFFSHASADPTRDRSGPVSNLTRYLCAAAYLDNTFANAVIRELVASHRAVVPSSGIDLVPIIRHCLNARRMRLTRDILLTVFLLCGLYLVTIPTVEILNIAFTFGILPRINWLRRLLGKGLRAFLFGVIIVIPLVLGVVSSAISLIAGASRSLPHLGPLASGPVVALAGVGLLGLLAGTLLAYYISVFHTLGQRLQPGAPADYFIAAHPRAEARIREVDAAQCGNVTLYAGENPFIGAGTTERIWSITIELDRAKSGGDSSRWPRPAQDGYVPIDPVELYRVIRERLDKLNDRDLPENERIKALSVGDYVVGENRHRWEGPLVDLDRKIPYSEASQEAIDALIRHPQAGLRYYLRASVTDEGQAVRTGDRLVITSSDQEITVSAFVYVAVEGRMLYLEFVSTTLPPIAELYHIVDLLPKIGSSRFLTAALLHTGGRSFRDVIMAPFATLETLGRMLVERWSYRREYASAVDYIFREVGARMSVRELGAARSAHTYLQQLDAAKYTRIIERLITDTVLDFLTAKGVDTTAYRSSALAVINSGVVISGGTINAPIAAGAGSIAASGVATTGTAATATHLKD